MATTYYMPLFLATPCLFRGEISCRRPLRRRGKRKVLGFKRRLFCSEAHYGGLGAVLKIRDLLHLGKHRNLLPHFLFPGEDALTLSAHFSLPRIACGTHKGPWGLLEAGCQAPPALSLPEVSHFTSPKGQLQAALHPPVATSEGEPAQHPSEQAVPAHSSS